MRNIVNRVSTLVALVGVFFLFQTIGARMGETLYRVIAIAVWLSVGIWFVSRVVREKRQLREDIRAFDEREAAAARNAPESR